MTVQDAMRHKLIADLSELPIWYWGHEDRVTPWSSITTEQRDLIVDALKQWKEQPS
jgi:hypothetical protein